MNRGNGAKAANEVRREKKRKREETAAAAPPTRNQANRNDGSDDIAALIDKPAFSHDKWKFKPGVPDLDDVKQLKGKKAAHWFDEPRGWQTFVLPDKPKKCYRKDESMTKVFTGYKWRFKNREFEADFKLRAREYGDRGLATWCLLEKK